MNAPRIISETRYGTKDMSIADALLQNNEIWLEGEVTMSAVNEVISLLHIIEKSCGDKNNGIINEEVRLIVTGPGGSVNAALNLANYITHSPLNITGIAVNNCSSASALVWLACGTREIFPYSRIMLHETTHMICEDVRYKVDRLEEIVAELKRYNDSAYEVIGKAFCKTKEEIEELIGGKDYYIYADELEKMGVATIVDTL